MYIVWDNEKATADLCKFISLTKIYSKLYLLLKIKVRILLFGAAFTKLANINRPKSASTCPKLTLNHGLENYFPHAKPIKKYVFKPFTRGLTLNKNKKYHFQG
jgi:hypothetical protein